MTHTASNLGFQQNERGFAILVFVVLLALSMLVVAGSLKVSASNVRSTHATKTRSDRYYIAETGVNNSLNWLRDESQNVTYPFAKANFYTLFEKTDPTVGSNEGALFQVPTKIKLINTTNSAILTNSATLATAAFPATQNITTGAAFNAVADFAATSMGDSLIRLTLVDAIPIDSSKDYGPPPAAAPDTDFYPVYRVDAVSAADHGSHVYGYITGSMFYVDTIGFYGRDFLDFRQDCKSYPFVNGTLNAAALNAHCPIGSQSTISMQNNAEVYGSARTNGSVTNSGNHVCADFTAGCPNPGTLCEGAACAVPGLPTIPAWASHCAAGNLGPVTVPANGNVTLLAGADPTQHCWTAVQINNKGKLTLTTTTNPYWFQSIEIVGGNAQTQLIVSPNPASGTVTLYVDTIVGNIVNGNQALNPNSRPSQFKFYYLGAADIVFNGNSTQRVSVVAPNAGVTVQGNADFYGGVIAKDLTLTGSGTVIYDESLGGSSLDDMNLKLKHMVEYYN